MKKVLMLGAILLSMTTVNAQELPKPSPMAQITQKVGLNNIKIEYSRPSVKGREVFGNLVPFDKVWRLGANAPTKLTTDKAITFGSKTIEAGTYAIFAIPSKDKWNVVINTDVEQWGAGNYDENKNIAEVSVNVGEGEFTESLSITIQDLTSKSGIILIQWAKAKVAVPFTVNTHKIAEANIKEAIKEGEDLEKVYYNAAAYYKDAKSDFKTALKYVEKSIKVKPYHSNLFLKARILKESGKSKKAIDVAEQALKYAVESKNEGYQNFISRTIKSWKK